MNCKLYQIECQQTGGHKAKGSARYFGRSHPVAIAQKETSSISASIKDSSLDARGENFPIQEHDMGIVGQGPDCQSLRGKVHPLFVQDLLTAKGEENLMRLDQLFDNEILTSNIPYHDFSFLGDLVNDPSESLNEQLTITSPNIFQGAIHSTPAEISLTKYSPISPYSQQNDRVSGLGSLQPDSGPEVSEKHIPPGLFIAVEGAKTGFLGQRHYAPTLYERLMRGAGSNSTGATLAICIHDSMSRYPELSSGLNFEWLTQAAKHISKLDTAEVLELPAGHLPPKSLAAICIAGQSFSPSTP